jgi:hypothetical protein
MGKVKTNQFVLLGRVGWKDDIKFFENGACKQTIQLGVKRSQEKYHNFFISFLRRPSYLVFVLFPVFSHIFVPFFACHSVTP